MSAALTDRNITPSFPFPLLHQRLKSAAAGEAAMPRQPLAGAAKGYVLTLANGVKKGDIF